MNKTPAFCRGGRVSGDSVRSSPIATPPTFTILEIERVNYGTKCALARVEIAGVGILDVEFFRPAVKPAFIACRSIRSRFTGQYERSLALDADFAAAVLEAIQQRLDGDGGEE